MVEFVAMDMRPINIIEGEGFKRLVTLLEPGYTIPKRSTISEALTLKHNKLRGQVLAQIASTTAVSFTTDIWTSIGMEAYMAVTAHFINADWELQAYVLETKEMEESHTGENIAHRLGEVVDSFEIPNFKRVAIVHDNASNMTLCTETLRKQPEKWGKVQGVRCSGHTLQLCVNTAVKQDQIRRTVSAGRNLVSHFRKSAKATAALNEKQKQQNVIEHKLIQDVSTRWNSTHSMLERLVEQRWPVTAVLSDPIVTKKGDRTLDLTSDQWNLAQDTAEVLGPLITLTELLSREENVSLSSVVPMLTNIKKRHLTPLDADSPAIRALKSTLVNEIDTRWKLAKLEPNSVYLISAALDPRFKSLKFLDDEKKDLVYIEVVQLARHLHQRTAGLEVADEGQALAEDNSEEETAAASPQKKMKTGKEREIAMLLSDDDEEKEDIDDSDSAKQEMEQYLSDKSKFSSGPLAWWKNNTDRYPKLALAAKHCLCIPATSTPSERIFSKAGYIVNKTRNALLPENVDTLVFLAHNLKRV